MLPRLSVIFSVSLLLALAVQPALMAQEQTAPKSNNIKGLIQNADQTVQQTAPTGSGSTADAKPATEAGTANAASNTTAGSQQGNGDDSVKKDIILVLDNSGSMRKNDPKFLTSKAVTEFIGDLDEATRLAVIIFDQDVNLVVPLTRVTQSNREVLLKSLDRINYHGLFSDSPAAIERAIYELKNNGRPGAKKLIIFMTDGIVDTGNPQEDRDRSKWLRDNLAPDAAKAGIKIFGIAFTEKADFQLIQSLAQITGGEYYRVLRAEDLGHVFKQIKSIINKKPAATPPPKPEPASTPEPQKPVIIEMPRQPVTSMNREERIRSIIMITAAAVLILAVLAILVLLLKRGRGLKLPEGYVTEAYINDIHGYTGHPTYKLSSKPTMLGRVAGMDNENLDYIVIPESTIGRRHSLIEYKDYAYWIVDQGSINGTFVNDVPITSEVRLKHGDRIRLHKYEFEFVMPEMGDAGKTVISQTVLASRAPEMEEATELRETAAGGEGFELDFDLSGDGATTDVGESTLEEKLDFGTEDETLMPGSDGHAAAQPDGNSAEQEDEYGSEDATLMPGHDSEGVTPPKGTPIEQEEANGQQDGNPPDDETIMPGDFNLPEEDATIRKDTGSDDDFPDIEGPERRD